MVKIKLIAVGKTKDDWIREGIRHYQKLLKKYADLEIIEIKEEKITKSKDERTILNSEAGRISNYLKKDALWVALDVGGDEFTSKQFAGLFEKSLNRGYNHFIFILGG
ncbi:MAG: 23S rRNA (pseudouridine(1915)-N(3))-methyltransferase RlmH, partial [Candidatus Zixiibacteriota bacterium]